MDFSITLLWAIVRTVLVVVNFVLKRDVYPVRVLWCCRLVNVSRVVISGLFKKEEFVDLVFLSVHSATINLVVRSARKGFT